MACANGDVWGVHSVRWFLYVVVSGFCYFEGAGGFSVARAGMKTGRRVLERAQLLCRASAETSP